jgi:hypothetical protein
VDVGVDQDHQIVSESRIFDIGVLAIAGNFLRSLQHPIHLIEVDVAEQWGNDTLNTCLKIALGDRERAMTRAKWKVWSALSGAIS